MRKTILTLTIAVVFLISLLIYYSKSDADGSSNNDFFNEEFDFSSFNKMNEKITDEFTFPGYEEILGEKGDIVVVPDSITGNDESLGKQGLYQRNKKYVYKNPEKGVVIILSITAAASKSNNTWEHSIYYTENLFNPQSGDLSKTYHDNYPSSEVAQYSFLGNGFAISVLGISNNLTNQEVFTLSETAQFVDALSTYLN
ncbi:MULTISPECIES: hypothetical protein [unclassified Lysinibacillus]|uniref:hypothetical protein n=1 Tax=unclassified Lysinibacillus TaxID=2636778 RepID=UPI0035E06080